MRARLTLLALVLGISSWGDMLRLRNGSTVNGTFLGGTADDIRFLVANEEQHFARSDVSAIVFGPGSAPPAISETPRSAPPPAVDLGPDVVGAPFLRGASGYIALEREIPMMTRGGGMYGMGATVYRIQGPRSPVRIRQGYRIVFVVRLSPNDDPRQFQLYRLDSRMGYRQTQPVMGGTLPGLPVTINKIGESIYEIVPARALYPGEYAMSSTNSNESYCFGLDY